MKFFVNIPIYVFVLVLCILSPKVLLSQEMIGNEQTAIAYFNVGNYVEALPVFAALIEKSPDNAMYNYYYGVCLVKNNRFNTAAKEALLNAVFEKTPENCNFYLGNYFHALENWDEAIDFYTRYKGGKKERLELEFDKYLNMCMEKANPFKIDKGDGIKVFTDTEKIVTEKTCEKNFSMPGPLRSEWLNFQVNDQLTYHSITDFKTEVAKALFVKGWTTSKINDSLVGNTDVLRKAREETHNMATRTALVKRIIDSEQRSYMLLSDREKYFGQARAIESRYWAKTGNETVVNFVNEIAQREKTRNNNKSDGH